MIISLISRHILSLPLLELISFNWLDSHLDPGCSTPFKQLSWTAKTQIKPLLPLWARKRPGLQGHVLRKRAISFLPCRAHSVQLYQSYLDKCTPYTTYRWVSSGVLLTLFFLRIVLSQGWYIGFFSLFPSFVLWQLKFNPVCYSLGIYLLNLFLAFLQPKFDPSLSQDEGLEDGESSLPTKQDEEFRPFIRRLPEFKFWHAATRAIAISFVCTWFSIFNVPVFWPVLVVYFIILFSLTSKFLSNLQSRLFPVRLCDKLHIATTAPWWIHTLSSGLMVNSAATNPAHDQIPLRPLHVGQSQIQSAKRALEHRTPPSSLIIYCNSKIVVLTINTDGCRMH